jgi:hypothetical protein
MRTLPRICAPALRKQFLGGAIDSDNSGFVEVEELM